MAIKHFKGILWFTDLESDFDYDDELFEICDWLDHKYKYLHYIGDSAEVSLPSGVYSTDLLFFKRTFKTSLILVNFDTSQVKSMISMFQFCSIYGDLDLGKSFNTSNVLNMFKMFADCSINGNLSLGGSFNTSNVLDMHSMFSECVISGSLDLGDKFDTGNVTDMSCMFYNFVMPEGFTLGKHFDTSRVVDMECMFDSCKISKGFELGNSFYTGNVENLHCMFYDCSLPAGFTLGDHFDTSNVEEFRGMFLGTKFQKGFTLGNKFSMNKARFVDSMFSNVINGLKIHDLGENQDLDLVKVFQDATIADDYKFPSWLNLEDYVDEGGASIRYKGISYDFPNSVLSLLFVEKSEVTKSCRIDLLEMLKSGKSIERVRLELSNNGYDAPVVDCCIAMVGGKLNSSCMETIKKLMIISKEGYSSYTISEVKEKLLAKGYPKEIVYECILNYIGDQYLTL